MIMRSEEAKEIIASCMGDAFSENRYLKFVANLFKDYTSTNRTVEAKYIKESFRPIVCRYKIVGKYEDKKGNHVDILIVFLKDKKTIDRARTAQRNFVAHILKRDNLEAALVAFVPPPPYDTDWRLSFVKLDHSLEIVDDRLKTKEEVTPARRWSFLVGKNEGSHTAQSRFVDLLVSDTNPNLAELESAFDIETVTREFFQKYSALYFQLKEQLDILLEKDELIRDDFARKEISTVDFAKKTLGQIVFLYFLQKKGWFGVASNKQWGQGPRKFIRELFNRRKKYGSNFFNDILEPLFYEALAQDRGKDSIYPRLNNCRMPFLNGGLFEPMNGYHWETTDIVIPDELFSNDKKTKEGDVGNGILDIFDRYNFTVNENEPLEKEVAVDPEMLGKVFENLLDIKDRKSKGSFYTPREIVHYMCQESLINHLDSETHNAIPRGDWEFFIRKGHRIIENDKNALRRQEKREAKKGKYSDGSYSFILPETIRRNAAQIDALLQDIKIADPAVGSGAFPLGMINEIVLARKILDIYLKNNRTGYELKKHAITHSIYGVDIDPGAVEIAKLRLWLALVVDEDTPHPLPNLEHKIIQGDSLISEYEGIRLYDESVAGAFVESEPEAPLLRRCSEKPLSRLKTEELQNRIELFINESQRSKKETLKEEIDNLKWELIEATLKEQGSDEKIAEIRQFRNRNICPFFIWELEFSDVFRSKGGFDVVIGNPPYVQIQKFSGQQRQKDWQNQGYKTFAKTGDIYSLFYEKGNMLLKSGGFLSFITSNKWMRANYGKATRRYFLNYTKPLQLIDFGGYKLFASATVDTNILIFAKKELSEKGGSLRACTIGKDFSNETDIGEYLNRNGVELENLSEDSWIVGSKAEFAIKKRIEEVGVPLKEWDVSINYGIKTGYNEAFIIDGEKKDELIAKDPKSAEIIKPILRGRDLKLYSVEFANLWLINTHNGYGEIPAINIDDYPAIKEHLDSFEPRLSQRYDKGGTPYNLRNCAYLQEFEKEKIAWGNLALSSQFCLVKPGVYINAPSPLITSEVGIKYLLALLNSSLADYYIRSRGVTRNGGYFEYKPMFIEHLPIPQISKSQQLPYEILVDCIHLAEENGMDMKVGILVSVINGLVYDLYFAEEMKKGCCYITDRITEVLKPFKEDDSDEFKRDYIEKFTTFCHQDQDIHPGLIHRRNIKVVEIINGDRK